MRLSPRVIKFKPAAGGPAVDPGFPMKIRRADNGAEVPGASVVIPANTTPGPDGKIAVTIGNGPLRTPLGLEVYATVAAQNADGTSAEIASDEYVTAEVPEPPDAPESIEIEL